MAKLVDDPGQDLEYASVAASLAVLAGIAAADAACCHVLGRRSRGQDHRQAIELVGQIESGGQQASSALRRLLDLKDQAHYGLFDVSGNNLTTVLHQAERLISFATDALQR